ncbi:MAG TPA: GlsB/YeaQ/YmgE family stress response membrane protein, partial [Terriglobales bacterium]|nr:GlsB/YeaQ/YmgE family stress response membrane protein [Terriglobales bacterium]
AGDWSVCYNSPALSGLLRGGLMFWLLYVILVGLIAGWATGKIMKGSGYGPLMDIVLGIVGGIIGGWIMSLLGFYSAGGLIPNVLVAILGAVVLVWVVRKLKRA